MFEAVSLKTNADGKGRNEPFNGDAFCIQVNSVRGSIFQNTFRTGIPSYSQDNVFLNAYQKRITSSGDQVVIGSDLLENQVSAVATVVFTSKIVLMSLLAHPTSFG